MRFRIERIETVRGSQRLYVDVAFLQADKVVHRNDFIMEIRPTHVEYIGRVGPDGERLDQGPEYYEERANDVAAEILANIRRYAGRATIRRLDNRDGGIATEDSDPLGLRAAPGVAELIGAEVEA
jgi:hypothetical protein